MPSKVDKYLTTLVNKFFSPNATLFERQEAIIDFMAHVRFPADKNAKQLVFSIYDSQYKAEYILNSGLEAACKEGLDIASLCKNVIKSRLFFAREDNLGLYGPMSFHLNSIVCCDITEFLLVYQKSTGLDPSIKKAHYFFQRYVFERNEIAHNYNWRQFNKYWSLYKNVSFFLLSNIDTDDLLNFSLDNKSVLDAVDKIVAAPELFAVFLRKARYIFDELTRILDRRATAGFKFPELPPSFTPLEVNVHPFDGEALAYMKEYTSYKYD